MNRSLPFLRTRGFAALLALGVLAPQSVWAHGTLIAPKSRVYRIYEHNVENPTAPWAKAALAISTKNAFYTWNQVSQNIPSYNHRQAVPDGHLASGGNPIYFGIDLVRPDWPATPVASGNYQLLFNATAPHEPSFIDLYITKADYDPSQTLTWDRMEKIGSKVPYWKESYNYWRINVTLPPRTGKHVLWMVWQRIDPVGEAFFVASDLVFDGSVTENVIVPTPDNTPPSPPNPVDPVDVTYTPPSPVQAQVGDVRVNFSSDEAWAGGYRAKITVTNLGTKPLEQWKVNFKGNFIVTTIWEARYLCVAAAAHSVAHPAWAPNLAPGASASFGFVVSGPLAAPTDFGIEGITVVVPENPPSSPTLKTELKFDSVWGSGFTGTLRLTNTGKTAVEGWSLAFEAPFKIGSVWNGSLVSSNGAYVITAASWNQRIEPGKSIDVGFSATGPAKQIADILVRTGK
ncbi:lytic polysaccharide monooxygenase [Oleiharenicola lentus]|uniref:lytic polysaccharide monooxygenase n=1 Tax=Oleiharenicola lentus TaxID=2508720 RepID=UPI003F676677